jgi:DNA-binding transcriptional MerR regulator
MRIGDLADRAGVRPHTIRYYEREGLLPPPRRTSGKYRDYEPEALEDLRFIRKAQTIGLSLGEVREVMAIASGGRAPCDHVRAILTTRLTEVEERLRELRILRSTLRAALERLDRAPEPREACRCAVIEAE